jgi:hypothetical protein
MSPEERLREVLRRADEYEPSIDLFPRVQRSIDEDAARRRRLVRMVAAMLAGLVTLAVWLVLTGELTGGHLVVTWWAVELAVDAVLVVLILVLGPLIKRFGRSYSGEVFRANPPTGDHFLRLFDLAYYLIFVGYLLMTTSYEPRLAWTLGGLRPQLDDAFLRLGGLLLLMGVLHGLAIVGLPVIALLFSSGRRREVRAALGEQAAPPDPRAQMAERVAATIAWAIAALVVVGGLLFAVIVVLGLRGG